MVLKTAAPAPSEDDPEPPDVADREKPHSHDISPTAGIVLFVVMMVYMAAGYLFAPEMPDGGLSSTIEKANFELAWGRFWNRWYWNGLCLCAACLALYFGFRHFVHAPPTTFDRVVERIGDTHIPTCLGTVILLAILAAALIPLLLATLQSR